MTRDELLALEREIKTTLAHIRRKRAALGEHPREPFEQDLMKEYDRLIADLEGEGVSHLRGIGIEELAWITAKQSRQAIDRGHGAQIAVPGLARIARELVALDAAEATERQRQARWPTPGTTHPYRYRGPRFKALWGDRYLEPGDVVELSEAQAKAFGDRFEAEATVAAS